MGWRRLFDHLTRLRAIKDMRDGARSHLPHYCISLKPPSPVPLQLRDDISQRRLECSTSIIRGVRSVVMAAV